MKGTVSLFCSCDQERKRAKNGPGNCIFPDIFLTKIFTPKWESERMVTLFRAEGETAGTEFAILIAALFFTRTAEPQ